MAATSIKRVAVIGTGVIGASWTAHFLAHGLEVIATDADPKAELRLRAAVAEHWSWLRQLGAVDTALPDALRFEPDLERAVAAADFVQENAPERLDIKQELFRRMDAVAPPEVVLATSSSGILVSEIQRVCVHPQRVLVGHPINPPHVIPLVEVIGGAGASQTSIDVAMAFYRGTGKRPILVRKEVKGHIVNRLQAALWQEAIHLVATDAATVAEVDAAIAHAAGLRWAVAGPFVNLHLSGGAGGITRVLETLGPAIESWWRDLGSVSLTPQLIAKIAAGVAAELGSIDAATLARERDAAVIRIIAAVNLRDDTPPT